MIQNGIMWLLLMFPDPVIEKSTIKEYNLRIRSEAEYIRDFIVLHYAANERYGDPFWDHCRNMALPDTLSHRMELFKKTGRIFQAQDDIFTENSWVQVMLGQGVTPTAFHNIAAGQGEPSLDKFMQGIRDNVENTVAGLPRHADYIKQLMAHAKV